MLTLVSLLKLTGWHVKLRGYQARKTSCHVGLMLHYLKIKDTLVGLPPTCIIGGTNYDDIVTFMKSVQV